MVAYLLVWFHAIENGEELWRPASLDRHSLLRRCLILFPARTFSAFIGAVSPPSCIDRLDLPDRRGSPAWFDLIKISPSIQFFGRSFGVGTADGTLLAIIYGLAALWFFGTEASGTANRFVSLGLMIVSC